VSDGFTYRGQHSSVLGLTLLSLRLNPPEIREYEDDVSGRHGTIDYGTEFGKRDIEIQVDVLSSNENLKVRVSKIMQWLDPTQGASELIFDELPELRYLAKYTGRLGIEQQIVQYGVFAVTMKCTYPFGESVHDTSAIEYDQGLEYGQGYEYSLYSTIITASGQTLDIDHFGTVAVGPLIRITGAFTNLSINDGANIFTFTGTNITTDVLEIDCSKPTVKKNGANAYGQSNGVFLMLKPGITTLICTATSPDFSIEVIFRHTFL
jgi:predicted phage tail component-like protein